MITDSKKLRFLFFNELLPLSLFENMNLLFKLLFCGIISKVLSCKLYNNKYLLQNNKKYFMTPFYGWGSTGSSLEPLRDCSLLFTTKAPETPGTHFIDLGRMKS